MKTFTESEIVTLCNDLRLATYLDAGKFLASVLERHRVRFWERAGMRRAIGLILELHDQTRRRPFEQAGPIIPPGEPVPPASATSSQLPARVEGPVSP
jgi:hypothetical protein